MYRNFIILQYPQHSCLQYWLRNAYIQIQCHCSSLTFELLTCETLDDQRCDHLAFLWLELLADPQQHEHVVTLTDTHCIQVTQHVCTSNLALQWKSQQWIA